MKLRLMKEQDLERVLCWRNDLSVRKNMYTSHEISRDEHNSWFNSVRNDSTKRHLIFSIDNVDLGVINFTDINPRFKSASWGFYSAVDSPAGTGLCMEYCALNYAFEELNLHKLNCEVIEFNSAVVNLHKKCGFQVEGILRDCYSDGESFFNVVRLGIVRDEWLETRVAVHNRINKRSAK